MLQTKVSCWFCNEESSVFVLNKNAWTCDKCGQYNGFNKDGDYNKPIPEMQTETRRQFCTTPVRKTNNSSCNNNMANSPASRSTAGSGNVLCDKCNNLQELKLAELNKFDAKVSEDLA